MSGLGILTGLIGSISTNIFGFLSKKEDRKILAVQNTHDEKRWEHEALVMELQSQADVANTEQDIARASAEGTWEGLVTSQKVAEKQAQYGPKWANGVVILMRPAITTTLLVFTVLAGWAAVSVALESQQLITDEGTFTTIQSFYKIMEDNAAVAVLLDLTGMAIAWWYGDRSTKRILGLNEIGGSIRAAGGKF